MRPRYIFYILKSPRMHTRTTLTVWMKSIPRNPRMRFIRLSSRSSPSLQMLTDKRWKGENNRSLDIKDAEIKEFYPSHSSFVSGKSKLVCDGNRSDRSITWIEYIRSAFAQRRDWSYVDRCRLLQRSRSANSTRIEDSPFFSVHFSAYPFTDFCD